VVSLLPTLHRVGRLQVIGHLIKVRGSTYIHLDILHFSTLSGASPIARDGSAASLRKEASAGDGRGCMLLPASVRPYCMPLRAACSSVAMDGVRQVRMGIVDCIGAAFQ